MRKATRVRYHGRKTKRGIVPVREHTRMNKKDIKKRLEYLRREIRKERISWGEIAELQSLAPHIEKGDVELEEWAGVPEKR